MCDVTLWKTIPYLLWWHCHSDKTAGGKKIVGMYSVGIFIIVEKNVSIYPNISLYSLLLSSVLLVEFQTCAINFGRVMPIRSCDLEKTNQICINQNTVSTLYQYASHIFCFLKRTLLKYILFKMDDIFVSCIVMILIISFIMSDIHFLITLKKWILITLIG